MLETDDFRAIFFDEDDFAVSVTLNGQTFSGIFDSPYQEIGLGVDVTVSGAFPTIMCRSVDVTGVAYSDAITVDGEDYTVREIMPDGTGMTTLGLEQA